MAEELDFVARYAKGEGLAIRKRTVLVEGTTDVELFQLAARLEHERTGTDLLGSDLAIVAAGIGHLGGTRNLCRRLWVLRDLARHCLSENGSPRYRFIGLFDNDKAGKQAVRTPPRAPCPRRESPPRRPRSHQPSPRPLLARLAAASMVRRVVRGVTRPIGQGRGSALLRCRRNRTRDEVVEVDRRHRARAATDQFSSNLRKEQDSSHEEPRMKTDHLC